MQKSDLVKIAKTKIGRWVLLIGLVSCVLLLVRHQLSSAKEIFDGYSYYLISPDGKWCLAGKGAGSKLTLLSVGNDVAPTLIDIDGVVSNWAPDSQSVYFTKTFDVAEGEIPYSEIGRKNLFDNSAAQFLVGSQRNRLVDKPTPSPDGLKLAFHEKLIDVGDVANTADTVAVLNLKTGGEAVFNQYPLYDLAAYTQWANKGNTIAYKTGKYRIAGSKGLVVSEVSQGYATQFLSGEFTYFRLSPDGSRCVFLQSNNGQQNNQISIVNVSTRQDSSHCAVDHVAPGVVWSDDGRYIYYVDNDDNESHLQQMDVDDKSIVTLTQVSKQIIGVIALKSGRLYYSVGGTTGSRRLMSLGVG